ncbi:prosaposin-like [Iris pallida]|uniref:Pulmonary surfactant-associated protein B n=1 Tax=Iris pallida TaxID=29817 RepID=A0AAX6F5S1_IRIPA|nr:prosaposin-like [Iris pallida]KAJ6811539.1 prosaposin-like [Iris pallida]KAJ6818334.1 prosaposin-like [Iris pallida]
MGLKIVSILLLVIAIGCIHVNARSWTSDSMVIEMDRKVPSEVSIEVSRKEEVCTLCQDFTTQAVQYLADNKTQTEIIGILHLACSHLHSFKHQCKLLVDYYAPLFFTEMATVKPELFCEKVNLCNDMTLVHLSKRDNACTLCLRVVDEVRTKLQDPETQLEVIEVLLKGCNKIENFVQECKKLVFEYGPLILANAEKFLETTDICVATHVCRGSSEAATLKELLISSA